LVEESRTNLLTYSEDFSGWNNDFVTLTSNSTLAPDGTLTATKVQKTGNGYLFKSGVVSNDQTKSIWARTVSGTGTVALLSHNSVSGSLVTLTEEWQRFDIASNTADTGGSNFYAVDFRAGTLTEVLVWGAQLEAGSFPTSYIPSNSGSTTTRSADVASIGVSEFGYNQDAGTVVVEARHKNGASDGVAVALNNEGVSNSIITNWYTGINQVRARIYTDSSIQVQLTFPANPSEFNKVGLSFAENNFIGAINGDGSYSDTSGILPLYTPTALSIGAEVYGSARIMSGHIKSIKYYPRALTADQLEALTS
jgi:hypothetical protein